MSQKEEKLPMLEELSTPMLENLIRMDGSSEADQAVILRALEILQQRMEAEGKGVDVDAAWESFCENYLPLEEPLYDEEPPVRQKPRRVLRRVLGVAAAAAALAAILSITVAARGDGLWKTRIFQRGGNFYTTVRGLVQQHPQTVDQNSPLASVIGSYGVDRNLLPDILPEDFALVEVETGCSPFETTLTVVCSDGDREILLHYNFMSLDPVQTIHEMDEGSMESYMTGGTVYSIYTNGGRWCAIWYGEDDTFHLEEELVQVYSGIVECDISNCESREELQDILDSIPSP